MKSLQALGLNFTIFGIGLLVIGFIENLGHLAVTGLALYLIGSAVSILASQD